MFPSNCQGILIGCGAEKQLVAARAAELYTSRYFEAKRLFARSTGMPWAILSAKHGVLSPDSLTQPYEESMENFTRWERREWAAGVALQIFEWQRYIGCVAIVAGEAYLNPLTALLASINVRVVNPCQGLGIGQQMAWLKKNTRTLAP